MSPRDFFGERTTRRRSDAMSLCHRAPLLLWTLLLVVPQATAQSRLPSAFGPPSGTPAANTPPRLIDPAWPRPVPQKVADATPPLLGDANINAVHFVSTAIGWCVGDRGVIWKTVDGGASWKLLPSPVQSPLRAAHFLTDQVGWVVGGGVQPHTRLPAGVVLFTEDGGRNWRVTREDGLPQLTYVRFFGLDQGIAVGEATQEFPTGVLTTSDGGHTWTPLAGELHRGWRAAVFSAPEFGLLAGRRGQVKVLGGQQLMATQTGDLGLRTVQDIALTKDDRGWLVGDGGLMLRSENGGVTWNQPTGKLPQAIAGSLDFRAVATHGTKVWIAGRPGGVVWHSPDDGITWQKQFTRQTVPIHDLTFVSPKHGTAVGAFGLILSTSDGGRTWNAIRGDQRRAALLALAPRPERISFPLLTVLSGAEGYRSVVRLPARRDIAPGSDAAADMDWRLQQSVTAIGGGSGEIDWRWPVDKPELERQMAGLVADWNARSDGKFANDFLDALVLTLRTWRPSVITIDRAGDDDALGRLLSDALQHALVHAADPTAFVHHQELAGVSAWQVQHVYERDPPGSAAHAEIDPHEFHPRLGTAPHVIAQTARSQLIAQIETAAEIEAWRQTFNQVTDANGVAVNLDFFVGLNIEPGSDARRMLPLISPDDQTAKEKLYKQQRNFQSYVKHAVNDSRQAANLVANLRTHLSKYNDREAALQLWQLALDYQQQARWDLVETTYIELVSQYPNEPPALKAMEWLFQFWSSAETAYHRAKQTQVSNSTVRTDVGEVNNRIANAFRIASQPALVLANHEKVLAGPDPVQYLANAGRLKVNSDESWRTGSLAHWHEQSLRMAALIRKRSPAFYATPGVQFPLANLLRNRDVHGLSDSYYRRFESLSESDRWQNAAAAELWLNAPLGQPPKTVVHIDRVTERPKLDATLADPCWQKATIMPLKVVTENPQNTPGATGFIMMAWDDEFLYLAASVPRESGVIYDDIELPGRKHDAALTGFDRLSLFLDVDRDYATWYTFEVDQRGQTRDACWQDTTWNPQWFVAAEADEQRWRIEAAIPFKHLAPQAPKRGTVWAVGVLRTIPGIGWQSWTLPAGEQPTPEGFGIVRFR